MVDTYNQPVEGEYFKIMTDTDAVLVDQKSFRTNKHGEMLFEISRIQNGSYCIQIVDPIYEEVYEEKCFLQKLDTKRSITSFLMADSFSSDDTLLSGSEKASQQLSDFDMRSFPEVVYRGEPVGIEIAALDSEGSVLSNYNGKIHFSVMDQEGNIFDDVSLPADTRFALASKGVQSFDLSINFHKEGVYTLVVNDVEKPSVQTEITDIRVQTRPLSTDMDTSSEKPRILYPEDGVVLSQTDIEVYGDNITPYADVLIYDGRKKIAEIESDRGGEFRYIFQDMKE
ncbi:MAG: hypothetical protein U9Q15_01480 [Patescibacteria group bacterium]|nr:hypothetical protein [Patescibacteria group bacterium]